MVRSTRGAARRRGSTLLLARLLLGGAGALTLACASAGTLSRQRALEAEWERGAASEPAAAEAEADPFAGAAELSRAALVAEVLRRNPSVRAARFAWRAALARYPQVTSLEDPRLDYGLAPASLGSRQVEDGHRVGLAQPVPFPGKLRLRGEVALAEAEAARHDFEGVRLRLATLASLLFDDRYVAERALEITAEHARLLEDLRAVAVGRYEAGEVSAQAPLQAELEQAELERRSAVLETERAIVVAQLNALLHRSAEAPLPPPPASLAVPEAPALDRGSALEAALAARPELRAAEARIRGGEAAVGLARREFLPDFELIAEYDGLWEVSDLRPFVGVSLNVPLQLGRRRAALEEARAELERARSERAGLEDEVRASVATSVDRLDTALRVLALYRERLLPTAREQVEAALAAFEVGRESFLVVIEAERALRDVALGYEEALAEVDRRATELRSATGALPLP